MLNKIDKLEARFVSLLEKRFPEAVCISAAENLSIDKLKETIEANLFKTDSYELKLPYDKTALVSKLHEIAIINKEDYRDDGIYLEIEIDEGSKYLISEYIAKSANIGAKQ